ncbi:MAG: hypothetical protein PCFJNLEI_04090 [Verrucomicrobiae bacterium]|nr:hypothetical protein [Verrucomicrobiae bacterium]
MSTRFQIAFKLVPVALVTLVATSFFAPFLFHISVALYGLPAAMFVLLGYGVWIVLRSTVSGDVAWVFWFSFLGAVLVWAGPLLIAIPWLPFAIAAPTLAAWLITKGLSIR